MGGVWLVLIVAVLGIGGVASWPYWSSAVRSYLPGGTAQAPTTPEAAPEAAAKPVEISNPQLAAERRQLRESLNQLMTRMETIEKAVDDVKKLAQATTSPSEKMADLPALKNLAGRLEALEENGTAMKTLLQRIDRVEKNTAEQAQANAEVEKKIEAAIADTANMPAAREGDSPQATAARALVLAVANLRQALAAGEPFADSLDALKALAGDNPEINTTIVLLSKNAATGLPTVAVLGQRFSGIAGKIVQASRTQGEKGWLDRVGNRLSSLVSWRRIDGKGQGQGKGNGKGADIDAMVAATESHLKAGDLKAAIKAAEGLSVNAKAAAAAASWLSAAKARLSAGRAAASLQLHAISQLTPLTPGKG